MQKTFVARVIHHFRKSIDKLQQPCRSSRRRLIAQFSNVTPDATTAHPRIGNPDYESTSPPIGRMPHASSTFPMNRIVCPRMESHLVVKPYY